MGQGKSNPIGGTAVYKGDNSGRGPSPGLWGNLFNKFAEFDYAYGDLMAENFLSFGGLVATNVGQYAGHSGSFYSFEDTGGSIKMLATEIGGVVRLLTPATDNKEAWMQAGGLTTVQTKLDDSSGNRNRVRFEARLRMSSIADTVFGWFCGLAEEGSALENFIADAGTLVDKDLIGFFRPEGDGDGIDIVHQKAGGGLITVQADAVVPVVNTFVKLGFDFNFLDSDGPSIRYFANGVQVARFALTAGDPPTFPATFPDAEELAFIAGLKTAAGTASSLDLDWAFLFTDR